MNMSTITVNREGWLTEVAKNVEPMFSGMTIKSYRVSCSWPHIQSMGRVKRWGECFGSELSSGDIHEIFISPLLQDPLLVAGTLCHELCHVVAGTHNAHNRIYASVCAHIGLTSGPAVRAMPGERLTEILYNITQRVGNYPHNAIKETLRTTKLRTPSKLSLTCIKCGCKVVMGFKWLELSGRPRCGCGGTFDSVDL